MNSCNCLETKEELFFQIQIPDYRNAIIVARNPNSVKRATSYAERLRLGIAVIHGEGKIMEHEDYDREDGRNSPPLPPPEIAGERTGMGFGLEILPGMLNMIEI